MRYKDSTMPNSEQTQASPNGQSTTHPDQVSPAPALSTGVLFGVTVIIPSGDKDRLESRASSAEEALLAQQELLTRLDARERENAQTRRQLLTAIEACVKALVQLDGPAAARDAIVALVPQAR